jgi:hypothetical protein
VTFSQRITELIDRAYDSGYYAGRLMDSTLTEEEANSYHKLLEETISRRRALRKLILHLYAPRRNNAEPLRK